MKKFVVLGSIAVFALAGCKTETKESANRLGIPGAPNMQVSSSVKDLEEVIQQYHTALDAFVRGRPEPMKALFSRADDVVLANPFGPAVQGWDNASAALDYASSRFKDGKAAGFDRMASYVAADLATIYEVEQGEISVGDGPVTAWVLRTTTTFRREDGTWKVVHRHADPISTASPEGPLRTPY